MYNWYMLPIRVMLFPLVFLIGCSMLLANPAIHEYATADEVLRSGRIRSRGYPLREWLVTALQVVLPELR